MSNLSQFAGGTLVGSQVIMADLGPTITLADSSTWMRAGILTTAASAPQLAALPQYKVVSGVASTLTASVTYNPSFAIKMASDGAGTVVSLANQNGIIRSTDYGATWSALIVGGGLTANYTFIDIIYANGKFLTVFQNGTGSGYQFGFCYSTTGAASTWTTYYITNPIDWSGNSWGVGSYYGATLKWTGTYFVAALVYRTIDSGINGIFLANLGTTGTALAGMYRPAATLNATQSDSNFDASASTCYLSSNGAGGLIISSPYTRWAYSANHGTTWTFYYGYGGPVYLVGTKVFATVNNVSHYVYATPASTPTLVSFNVNVSNFLIAGNGAGSNPAGSKVFAYRSQLGQVYEFDTTTYTTIVSTKQVLGNLYTGNSCVYIDNKFIVINSELGTTATRSYTSDFSNVLYYGLARTMSPYTTTTNTSLAASQTWASSYYVRVS